MANAQKSFNVANHTAPGFYRPSQTALLLLDFHSSFVHKFGGPAAVAALQVAADMGTWARSQNIQVIHCLIDLDSTPFATCKNADRLTGLIATVKSGSGGQEPEELVEGDSNDITFTRRPGHVSALKSPGLLQFLAEKGIKSLVLAGLSTSGCVMRTAVAANDEEYVVSVISNGCADPAEGVHDLMIGKILNNRGYVFTADEFKAGFAEAEDERSNASRT